MAKIALFKFDKKGKFSVEVCNDAADYQAKISKPGLYYVAGLVEVIPPEAETEKLMDELTDEDLKENEQ